MSISKSIPLDKAVLDLATETERAIISAGGDPEKFHTYFDAATETELTEKARHAIRCIVVRIVESGHYRFTGIPFGTGAARRQYIEPELVLDGQIIWYDSGPNYAVLQFGILNGKETYGYLQLEPTTVAPHSAVASMPSGTAPRLEAARERIDDSSRLALMRKYVDARMLMTPAARRAAVEEPHRGTEEDATVKRLIRKYKASLG